MIDLTEWEKRFALSVQNTELLGDIELTENEFMDLQQKLKDYIKEHGYVYLNSRAPLSLAVFLVRIGIKEYNEGNYWSAVQKALEIPGNDPRWQGIFGNSFLKTLDYYNLAKFYAPGLKYVTPILIHGRIPDNYLENFFDVILDLFADNFEDNLSKEYIKNTVRLWREDHFGRLETQRELDDTKEKLKKVNEELAKYENIKKHWSLYEKAKEISENIFDTDELSSLLELPENFMENTIAEIEKLKQELYEKRSLLKPVKDYLAERSEHNTNLSAKQLALNKITGDIELFTGKLKVPITDILGKEILALPFHKLEAAYEKYASLSKDNIIKLFILKIFQKLFGKKSKEEIYISEIKELVANIPFKEDVLKDIHEVYNTIKNLRNLFNEYFSYKEEVEKLEIILEQLEVSFLEIAAGEALSNLLVNGNNFTLKLEEEINSQVHKLNVLEKNLIDYKTNLVALGKGVLAKGKEILAEQRNYRKYLSQISGKIKTEIPTEIFETIQDINMLNNQIEELKMNKNELSEYIMATEKKIKSYPEPLLYNLNESAKKFIYFGESIAEDFVYETANMLKKLLYEEDIKQVKLPSHIQESAKEWIIKLKEEIGKIEKFENAQQEHLFRTPAIYYDSDLKEIKLSIPEQRLSKTLLLEDKIVIKIYKGDFQDLLKQEELRLYSKDGCLLTEEATINLIESAKNYTVVLECGNSNIKTWIIPMMNEDIPFILFDQKGKKINIDKMFVDDRSIIILEHNIMIEPSEIIEGGENLYDKWSGYKSCYLNLTGIAQIILIKDDNIYTFFREPDRLKPALIGQNKLHNITINDAPVYMDFPPEIIFSEKIMQLRLWSLILKKGEVEEHFVLDKVTDLIVINNEIIRIPLSRFNNGGKYGSYRLILEKRGVGGIKYEFSFSILPNTYFKFDKEFYEPYEPSSPKNSATLRIKSTYPIDFTPVFPDNMEVHKSKNACIVRFIPNNETISGELTYSIEERRITYPIKISVPAIRWKYDSSEMWSYETKELWHEDIENLSVFIPIDNISKVVLFINNREQQSTSNVLNKITAFNLSTYKDSFRENKKSVQDVFIEFPEKKDLATILLNRVRTRWEVSEIKVNHEIEDNKRILRISWEEKGKATNKAIAVWDIHSNTKFFDIELGSDTREVVVVKSLENFPDGDYRIQFYELDIWGTTVAIMPESGEDNTADVQIGVFVETIDNVIKHGIRLAFLTDDKNKNLYCAFPSPLIKDIQPIKGTEIETEYQGWFYHVNTDGLLSPILTNPVRFIINIEDRSLPYLLDCDNDGAMYCPKCKEFFWEIREKHKKCHVDPRKMFFYINR